MKYDVLVVDDEESLVRGIVRGLSAVPTLNPVGVNSLAEAVAVLDRAPPDLLLTDIRLAGESGLDLISEVLRRGLRIPVVVMTAYRAAFSDELSQHGGLTVLEKPVALVDLRRIVEERLAPDRESRGKDPFDLLDYIQLAKLGRISLHLEIELESGAQGSLDVVDGEIWNARANDAEGREAVASLLGTECRKFRFTRLEERPRERQLKVGTESLLLEIATASDEAKRHRGAVERPASEAVPRPAEAADAARRCQEAVEEVTGALCCRLLEIGTAAVIARWPAEAREGEERPGTNGVLALFRISWTGSVVEEVSVTCPAGLGILKRVSANRVLTLSTAKSVRPGLAWLALRRAAACLAATLPPETSAPAGADGGAPLPRRLEPALDRATAHAAAGIAGARSCAVVHLHGPPELRGASHPDAPELASAILARSADLFSTARGEAGEGDPEAVDEVVVSATRNHYLLARFPDENWLAVLVADTTVRMPAARLGLRDALPALTAALRVSGTGG